MSLTKRVLLYVMAAFYVFGGFNHLMNPEFYLAIMPPNLPEPELLNVASGLAEIVLGVYLLDARTRPFAAWGVIALLVAVFPANVYVAQSNWGPEGAGSGNPLFNYYLRYPMQIVFLVWAWWYTLPESPAPQAAS